MTMRHVQVTSQEGLDAVVNTPDVEIELAAEGTYSVRAGAPGLVVLVGSPQVEAHGTSEPRVVAHGTSQPQVVAYDTSEPRVVAHGTSQPQVVAYDTSEPRVVAHGTSQPQVVAHDTSQPLVVAYDTSQPLVVANDTSQPRVVANDTSQPLVVAYGTGQPRVVAYGTSQPLVVAYGTGQPRVVAHDTSQPLVVAHGTGQPRVVAYGTSQPLVVANGYTQIMVMGSVSGAAAPPVAICHDGQAQIVGGQQTVRSTPTTAQQWCDYQGVPVEDGVAILYKGVRDNYQSAHGTLYTPGTMPEAVDWDNGVAECGGGLHFSPRPLAALAFDSEATRFVRCPVALADMRAPQQNDVYPSKIKARRVCRSITEVTIDGDPV